MKTRSTSVLLTIGFSLTFLAAPAWADKKGEDEKAEKDLDKAEKGQKKGGQKPEGGENPFENPLEKILDLMRGVEDKLFEAQTGDFTQAEQQRIVEAMRFEAKTKKALDKLIDKIQNSQQSSSSSSSSSQDEQQKKKKKKQQQKNQRNQKQKSKQQQQKEKEQEKKRQAQKQKQQQQQQKQDKRTEQQKKQDQAKKKKEQQKKAEQAKKMAEQRRRNGLPPKDKSGDLNDERSATSRWGNLPAKLFQDAANVRNRQTPSRYRRLIERYRERISGKKSD
ncbi:MAG: hypothetical protein JKY65_04770 [Planctomycetes bacterium]|nr:hypothetical protein [Planctomycetota bacterium]